MRNALVVLVPLLMAGNVASVEATRTLRAELSADASRPFRVENLAGRMVVRQGTGTKVVVTATVNGVDQKTADLMTLQEVRDSKTGHPTLSKWMTARKSTPTPVRSPSNCGDRSSPGSVRTPGAGTSRSSSRVVWV